MKNKEKNLKLEQNKKKFRSCHKNFRVGGILSESVVWQQTNNLLRVA